MLTPGLQPIYFDSKERWYCALTFSPFFFFSFFVLAVHFVLNVQLTQQTSMPPAGFKLATPASNRPKTLTLDRSATGIGLLSYT
jgi:hypothetical protein